MQKAAYRRRVVVCDTWWPRRPVTVRRRYEVPPRRRPCSALSASSPCPRTPSVPPTNCSNRHRFTAATSYRPGGGETICPPADGSSTGGGSTSVRGRVRSPHMAKLQAASVPITEGRCARTAAAPWDRQTDTQTDGSPYRLTPPRRGRNKQYSANGPARW